MPNTQELVDALRRIEHAPNQGDRGVSGKIADAAYKAHHFLQGGDPSQPSTIGNFASHVIGFPSVAVTADSISRDLPVDKIEAVAAALAPIGAAQLGKLGIKGLSKLPELLRK